MLVIGIDPGTASTGYGLVRQAEGGSLALVAYGVISTPPDAAMGARLKDLYDGLKALIALHRPESGAVERLFFQRNVSTALSVGQAKGVVLLAMAQAGMEIFEYTPREVKQAVSGYGNASKGQMQDMVRVLLGMSANPRPDDAADALAVAICHLHSRQVRSRIEAAS